MRSSAALDAQPINGISGFFILIFFAPLAIVGAFFFVYCVFAPRSVIPAAKVLSTLWFMACVPACAPLAPKPWPQTDRPKRVFDIDMQHGPNCCAGEPRIIPASLERPVFEKTLTRQLSCAPKGYP